MSHVIIREATIQDVVYVIPKSEVAQMPNADKVLTQYITLSDRAYIGEVDGACVCVWGVMRQSLLSDRGYIWLLTTEAAEEHKFLLIRYSQRIIENLLHRYKVLAGECVISDHRARRWMKFLGAEFSQAEGRTVPFQIMSK